MFMIGTGTCSDFLEQLRISHDINITGMLEEAQRMVNLMGKQNCKVQMMQAENELWEAQQREF